MSNEQAPQFCPTCGKFISDYKTRKRVMQFATDGVDVAHLADAVVAAETEPRVMLINPFSGPVKVAIALWIPFSLVPATLYQYHMIDGVLASFLLVGGFAVFAFLFGSNPHIVQAEAKPAEPPPESADESEPDAALVEHPFPHSVSIRFYEPPLRPGKDKVPVPWESIADVCRKALAGVPFSEREMTARAKISGPDFRLLAADFRRRGYSELQPDKTTLFTERGSVQVGKLASLPY